MKKQENTKNNNRRYFYLYLSFVVFLAISGCISGKPEISKCITINYLDSVFTEYYLIEGEYNCKDKIYILSNRNSKLIKDTSSFEMLNVWECYDIELVKIDTLVNATIEKYYSDALYYNGILIWSYGKIRIQLYNSDDMVGLFTKKK